MQLEQDPPAKGLPRVFQSLLITDGAASIRADHQLFAGHIGKVCDTRRLKNLEGCKLLPAAPGPGSEVPFGTCPMETKLF